MLSATTPNRELQRRWLLDLRRRNLRPRTVESYDERVDLLRRWADTKGRPLLALTTDQLERYLDGRGHTPATRQAHITALRSFYEWAGDHHLVEADPTADLVRPIVRPGRPRPVADDDLARGLAEADPQTRVILLLGALAGLRAAEMTGLRVEDVDMAAAVLEVVDGKGGKSRFVPVHPLLAEALRCLPMPADGPVLVDTHGRRLTRDQLLKRVRRVLDASTHQLRHTAGTLLWQASHDIRTVAEVLGHGDPRTSLVYARFDICRAAEVVNSVQVPASWR